MPSTERLPAPITQELQLLVAGGALKPQQAGRVAEHVAARGLEDLWADPYLQGLREHTRAHIERLLEQTTHVS